MSEKKPTKRLLSLDVFRGITIALMIIVNCPSNNSSYYWLEHSNWNGCTLADVVFPFFIFIVGLSTVFSLSKATQQDHPQSGLYLSIIKRAFLIFIIGLFLNAFPYHFDWATLRFYGVLQRIAICYGMSALLFLNTKPGTQALIALALLLGYAGLMVSWPVPGFSAGDLTQAGNFAAYIDRLVFAPQHLYGKTYDPEGLLSTLPALSTVLVGNITGLYLLSQKGLQKDPRQKCLIMIMAGFACMVTGGIWGLWLPINKALWSSPYVLWTGGLALLCFSGCYFFIEIRGWRRWCRPFEMFGVNALLAYFLHIFFLKIQLMIKFKNALGETENVRGFITEHLFGWASLNNASLLYALSYTFLWLIVLTVLYHKRIFLRL